MSDEPARTAARRTRFTFLAALVGIGAIVSAAALGIRHDLSLPAPSPIAAPPLAPAPPVRPQGNQPDAAGEADGVVPDGVTVFDDEYPAVARLDPALGSALRRAATDAADDGVKLFVNSGWRSPKYQEQLLREAILKYGSKEKAARWVASPSTSAHILGKAVDIGPSSATAWLSKHGAKYGLCQIYSDESWHYELRPRAAVNGCPPMYANPAHDPRLR